MKFLLGAVGLLAGLSLGFFLSTALDRNRSGDVGGSFRIRADPNGIPYSVDYELVDSVLKKYKVNPLLVIEPKDSNRPLDIWLKPSGDYCETRLNWAVSSKLPAKKPSLNYIIETGFCSDQPPGAAITHLSETWGTDIAMPMFWGFSTLGDGREEVGNIWHALALKPTPSMQHPTFSFEPNLDAIEFNLNPAKGFALEKSKALPSCDPASRGRLLLEDRTSNPHGDRLLICMQRPDGEYAWRDVQVSG